MARSRPATENPTPGTQIVVFREVKNSVFEFK